MLENGTSIAMVVIFFPRHAMLVRTENPERIQRLSTRESGAVLGFLGRARRIFRGATSESQINETHYCLARVWHAHGFELLLLPHSIRVRQ